MYTHTAHHLASLGRHGDTELLHVSPNELNALKGLGSLTRNPYTGLPEAFSLGDILPYVIGIGGSMMGLPTWALAAGQGLYTTAKTGDLTRGLMSGVLTAGLGSLAHGLMGGADAAAGQAGGQALNSAGGVGAQETAGGALGNTAAGADQVANAATGAGAQIPGYAGSPSGAAPDLSNISPGAAQAAGQSGGWGLGQMGGNASKMASGLSNLNPSAFYAANKPGVFAALGGQYGLGMLNERDAQKAQYDAQNAASSAASAKNAAEYQAALAGARKYNPYYNFGMSTGGLAGDDGRWDPSEKTGIEGLLSGPGHGMSDDIPAHIDGHTPAALSTDEFVIPADVVSHLGNGSTSAGAKHLYEMMARIRKARTGNDKQGKEIDVEKHLPA